MPAPTHGLSRKVREYKVWTAMKQRCFNPNDKAYPYYGGRGIGVCDEWRDSFELWLAYVGYRPTVLHSIERIDNDKGYEPGNVRWATKDVQQHNRRAFAASGVKGVYKNGTGWSSSIQRKGKGKYLGTFRTKAAAAEAYNRARVEMYE